MNTLSCPSSLPLPQSSSIYSHSISPIDDNVQSKEVSKGEEEEEKLFHILAVYGLFSIPEEDLELSRQNLSNVCKSTNTVGTLLVTKEGINGTVCTPHEHASSLMQELRCLPGKDGYHTVKFNVSYSSKPVFDRLRIRRKVEVVTMGLESCCGSALVDSSERGTYVSPEQWNDLLLDTSILVVDTRNDYEIHLGTFQGAVNPKITSFSEFPDWLVKNTTSPPERNGKKQYSGIAMFCTGGIRCEKSTTFCKKALQSYFGDNIYHLEGGILRYLKEIPLEKSLWKGECFVFDHRISVTHGVKETGTYKWCIHCKKRLSRAHESLCSVCHRTEQVAASHYTSVTVEEKQQHDDRNTTIQKNDDEDEVLYYVRHQQVK